MLVPSAAEVVFGSIELMVAFSGADLWKLQSWTLIPPGAELPGLLGYEQYLA